ncbi:acyltransferase family protein [Dyadobacter sp. 32]|uniref:acyltransferase family protein n=1 Tax=Dyadobacter sp. 32 TaxID=538966 RepID=UPI0011ECD434
MDSRIEYVDFIKGIVIFLMVMFHIPYVEIIKPFMPFVYSFHMPIFLFFSGYFIKTAKPLAERFYTLLRSLLIPYVIFEIIYLVSLYIAGKMGFSFQNSISILNFELIFHKVFIAPIGAYWYLHTLIFCMICVYIIDHFVKSLLNSIILIALSSYIFSEIIEGLKFGNCLFFITGYYFRKFSIEVPLSLVSIIPILLIAILNFETIKRGTLESYGLVFFSISFLGLAYRNTKTFFMTKLLSHLGRNTLIVVLLHPIFLNLFKFSYKWFQAFEPTGLFFIFLITVITIIASIFCSLVMDRLYVSKILFGKKIYVPVIT